MQANTSNLPTLAVMLRCHRRARSLRLVLRELLRYREFAEVKLHILADRLSTAAGNVLDEFKGEFWGFSYLPFPILSREGGQKFREAKAYQYKLIEPSAPDWVLLADDDRWFEPLGAAEELPASLDQDDFDILFATSWFVWDRSDQFNASRIHYSPVLFRFEPGMVYPLDRDIQVPMPLHDEAIVQGRTANLHTPLLDYGTFSEKDRAETYKEFVEAGKNDSYVASLLGPDERRKAYKQLKANGGVINSYVRSQLSQDLRSIDEELKRSWKNLWKEAYDE